MLSLLRSSERRRGQEISAPPRPLPPTVERDQILVAAARAGDADAVDELYRLHLPLAQGVARGLCWSDDVDDVVSEAFARVLSQIHQGRGPRVSFRAYLVTAVRSAAADSARKNARLVWTDEIDDVNGADERGPRPLDDSRPDSAVRHESRLLTDALADLPSRWQLVLWWTTVEQRPLAEVGTLLSITPNAAAALAFRAREGLREAYLRLHLPPVDDPSCTTFRAELVATLRARPDTVLSTSALLHLDGCEPCRDLRDDLRDLRVGLTARA